VRPAPPFTGRECAHTRPALVPTVGVLLGFFLLPPLSPSGCGLFYEDILLSLPGPSQRGHLILSVGAPASLVALECGPGS
jgi:hypothetical protein